MKHYDEWFSDIKAKRNEIARNYENIRAALVKRDGECCVLCGATDDLQIDHIKQVTNGGGNELSNLRLLCKVCNRKEMKKTPDGRPCAICGKPATRLFARWLCDEHYEECISVPRSTLRCYSYRAVLEIVSGKYEAK